MAAIAYLWKGQALLAGIIALAMTLNMIVAAVVGVVIPFSSRASGWTPPSLRA